MATASHAARAGAPAEASAHDALRDRRQHARILILPCGSRSLRFRPTLDSVREHMNAAVTAIARRLRETST